MFGIENIESFFDKVKICDKFYLEFRVIVEVGIIISYLYFLRKFYIFVMIEDDVGFF